MISVIIPVYNAEKYLENSVKSVLAQTFEDFEIIMVDDGSSDNSPAICDSLVEKDSRVRVIHKKNEGVSVARNTGLDAVKGDYIFFMDSDDLITENCFDVLMTALKSNDADIAMGNLYYTREDGSPIEKFNAMSPVKDEVMTNIDFLKKLTMLSSQFYCISCNKIFKTKLFDGIRYPVGKINEDEATIHKIVYNAKKIVSVEQPLYNYIKHPGSITTKQFTLKNLDREDAFYSRIKFLQEKGLDDIAEDTAFFALKVAPLTMQKLYLSGLYTDDVRKKLNEIFNFEYALCKDKHFPVKLIPLKIILNIITTKPDVYMKYLKLKYTFMKPKKAF